MSNTINVVLNGVDNLSSVISGSILKVGALGAAFDAAMGVVNGGISMMRQGLADAGKTQLDLIGGAGALMGVMDVDFSTATQQAESLNNAFVKLGANLPGTAEDFAMVGRSVMDDIINAYRQLDGSLDLSTAKESLLDLTESWTLLAQQTQTDSATAGQLLTRLIGGDTRVLKQVMFDKSPAFKNALNRLLEADGKTLKDFDDLTTKQRTEYVRSATRLTIPKEAVEAMSNTVSGLVASWNSAIFDPTTGAIGFLRKLPQRFNETALDAYFGMLKSVERVAQQIVRLFPVSVDFMEVLWDTFNWIGTKLDSIATTLASYKQASNIQLPSFDGLVDGLIAGFNWMLDGMAKFTNAVFADTSWVAPLVANLIKALFRLSNGFSRAILRYFTSINYGQVIRGSFSAIFQTLTQGIPAIISGMGGNLLANFRDMIGGVFRVLSSGISKIMDSRLGRVMQGGFQFISDVAKIMGSLFRLVTLPLRLVVGIFTIVGKVVLEVSKLVWGIAKVVLSPLQLVFSGIKNIVSIVGLIVGSTLRIMMVSGLAIAKGILTVLSLAFKGIQIIVGIIDNAVSGIEKGIDSVIGSILGFIDTISNLVSGGWRAITNKFSEFKNQLSSISVSSITTLIKDGIKSLGERIKGMFSVPKPVQDFASNTMSAFKSVTSNPIGAVSGLVSSVMGNDEEMTALSNQHNWGNSFGGNLKPLADAIKLENRMKPMGASLVVANSSEAILNRQQLSSIKATPRQYPPNITVNITESSSPSLTADAVINRLSEYFSDAYNR